MKILYIFNEITHILELSFVLEEGDRREFVQGDDYIIHFHKHKCQFIMPKAFQREQLHNDTVALSALLLVYPFIGNRILFEFPISKEFATILDRQTGKKIIYRRDDSITARRVSGNGVGGINFNATNESLAVVELAQDSDVLTLLDPIRSVNSDFQYLLMDMSYIRGKRVVSLKSDAIEMYREYYKNKKISSNRLCFDLAEYIPILLFSDYYTIKYMYLNSYIRDVEQLEMAHKRVHYYRTNRWKLYNTSGSYKNINSFEFWKELFSGVDLEVQVPLGGITRMGIQKIIAKCPYKEYLPICKMGYIGKQCGRCKSCLVHAWMNWYYHNTPLEFDMDKLKSCKIIYAYTLYYYRDSEQLKQLYENMKSRYPQLDRQMRTLQMYRSDSILASNQVYDIFKSVGIDKFTSLF